MDQLWQNIYDATDNVIASGLGKPKQVFGRDLIDLPTEELILYGTKLPYYDGTIEFTLATAAAHPTFEWQAEITLKRPNGIEHYLLRPNHTIVETYGKNVFDVSAERAQSLLKRLNNILSDTL